MHSEIKVNNDYNNYLEIKNINNICSTDKKIISGDNFSETDQCDIITILHDDKKLSDGTAECFTREEIRELFARQEKFTIWNIIFPVEYIFNILNNQSCQMTDKQLNKIFGMKSEDILNKISTEKLDQLWVSQNIYENRIFRLPWTNKYIDENSAKDLLFGNGRIFRSVRKYYDIGVGTITDDLGMLSKTGKEQTPIYQLVRLDPFPNEQYIYQKLSDNLEEICINKFWIEKRLIEICNEKIFRKNIQYENQRLKYTQPGKQKWFVKEINDKIKQECNNIILYLEHEKNFYQFQRDSIVKNFIDRKEMNKLFYKLGHLDIYVNATSSEQIRYDNNTFYIAEKDNDLSKKRPIYNLKKVDENILQLEMKNQTMNISRNALFIYFQNNKDYAKYNVEEEKLKSIVVYKIPEHDIYIDQANFEKIILTNGKKFILEPTEKIIFFQKIQKQLYNLTKYEELDYSENIKVLEQNQYNKFSLFSATLEQLNDEQKFLENTLDIITEKLRQKYPGKDYDNIAKNELEQSFGDISNYIFNIDDDDDEDDLLNDDFNTEEKMHELQSEIDNLLRQNLNVNDVYQLSSEFFTENKSDEKTYESKLENLIDNAERELWYNSEGNDTYDLIQDIENIISDLEEPMIYIVDDDDIKITYNEIKNKFENLKFIITKKSEIVQNKIKILLNNSQINNTRLLTQLKFKYQEFHNQGENYFKYLFTTNEDEEDYSDFEKEIENMVKQELRPHSQNTSDAESDIED
jgi:hypothetical protein